MDVCVCGWLTGCVVRGGGEQETVRRRRLFIPKRKPVEISHVRKLTVAKDSQCAERDADDGGGG